MESTIVAGVIMVFTLFAFYFFVRTVAHFGSRAPGARSRAYRQLAKRYVGRYERRGLGESPTVSFGYKGSQVRVGLAPVLTGQHEKTPRTRVVTRFAKGIPFRFDLAPRVRPKPLQPPKGTTPVTIAVPDFDRQFTLQANDADMAREFLATPIRRSLIDLQQLAPAGGMLVSINPERLLIQIDRDLGQSPDALAFAVHHALVIHDGLLEGVHRQWNRGIDIVDRPADEDELVEVPTCKVCGESIADGPVVVCATCKTPHHRDCWEYVGACSIYGCNGTVGMSE
jgi:hypothetical protein